MQIPVFETIARAYQFVVAERRDFIAYAALPIVAVALAGVLFLLPFAGEEDADGGGLSLALAPIFLVMVVTHVMFSVAWGRRYLEGNVGMSPGEALRWSPRHWQFVGQLLRLLLALLPVLLILLLLVGASGAGGPDPAAAPQVVLLAVGGVIAAGLILCRLLLVLPAAAVDKPLSMRRAWELTKGNSWRLLWLVALAYVLPRIAGLVTLLILIGIHTAIFGPITATGPLSSALVLSLVAQFFAVAGLAMAVTALSIVYKDVMARTAQSSGPPATRSQSG